MPELPPQPKYPVWRSRFTGPRIYVLLCFAGAAAVLITLLLPPQAQGRPTPPRKANTQADRTSIVAVRHGNLWVSDGSGPPRQITRSGSFQSVSVGEGVIAAVNDADGEDAKTNVYVWRPTDRLARQVTQTGDFAGVPFWIPGTRKLLVGHLKPNADADGGLWLVDAGSGATRRVLPDYDADFPVNNHLLLSPDGQKIISSDYSAVQILETKTLRPMLSQTFQGVTDIAWLDDNTLLLSGGFGTEAPFPGQGGIRAFNLRTRHSRRWLYSTTADVQQVLRSPSGNLLAVGLGHDGNGSQHIRIVNARTKAGYPLPLAAPAKICGFSKDGSQLLVLIPLYSSGVSLNAYAVDLKSGKRHLLMSDVSDAVWR